MNLEIIEQRLITDTCAHNGFPRVVRAGNGDLLLFYRIGTTHAYDDSVIAMHRSQDEGGSWSDHEILRQSETDFSAHNPVAIVTREGRIILWCSRYEYTAGLRHPCWWSTSDDDGHTWSAWSVFDPSADHSCYYITDAIHTSSGLIAGDATFPPGGKGSCHTRVHSSTDAGVTWAPHGNLTSPAANEGDEIGLLEVAPDQILCIQRDRARHDTFRTWSADGGRTWSERENIRPMLDCILQRPFLTRLDEDVCLLSGRDFGRKQVVCYLSKDAGQNFGNRLELDFHQRDGSYTSVVELTTGEFLIVWYSDSHTEPLRPDIKSAKLHYKAASESSG